MYVVYALVILKENNCAHNCNDHSCLQPTPQFEYMIFNIFTWTLNSGNTNVLLQKSGTIETGRMQSYRKINQTYNFFSKLWDRSTLWLFFSYLCFNTALFPFVFAGVFNFTLDCFGDGLPLKAIDVDLVSLLL